MELAQKRGVSIDQVVSDAIQREKLFDAAHKAGWKILLRPTRWWQLLLEELFEIYQWKEVVFNH